MLSAHLAVPLRLMRDTSSACSGAGMINWIARLRWWDIGDRVTLNRELGAAEQPQGIEEAWRAEALEAFRVAQAASRVSVAEHVERSRLELMSHAAHK
jgi:hypothetical protein